MLHTVGLFQPWYDRKKIARGWLLRECYQSAFEYVIVRMMAVIHRIARLTKGDIRLDNEEYNIAAFLAFLLL